MAGITGGKTQSNYVPGSPDASDTGGSYLLDALGALLTSTLVGAKQSLDVYDAADYATDSVASGTDIGQLGLGVRHDANTSIATVDGNMAPFQLDALGALKVSGTFTANFTAEHNEDDQFLDGASGIFTLLVRQDTLATSTSADGDYGAFKSNALGELYVHDTDVVTQTAAINTKLAALSHAEDAVAGDGAIGIEILGVRKDTSGSNVSASGDYATPLFYASGDMRVTDVANSAVLQQAIAVGTSAVPLPAVPLANRRSLFIENSSDKVIYIGSVTVTNSGATRGPSIGKGGEISLDVGPGVDVYGVSSAAAGEVLILESA